MMENNIEDFSPEIQLYDFKTNFNNPFSDSDRQSLIDFLQQVFKLRSFQYLIGDRQIEFVSSRSFACEFSDDTVYVNVDRTLGLIIEMFCKKGRMLQTHRHSLWDFEPMSGIMYYRSLHADYMAYLIGCWWEIELSGLYKGCFDEVCSHFKEYGWMFGSYYNTARDDFRSLNNGSALFNAWKSFFNREYPYIDRQFLTTILSYPLTKFKETPKHDIRKAITECMSIKGVSYIPKEFFNDASNSTRLVCVDNRTNNSFLWFIKFETQYQEAEDELKQSVDTTDNNIYNFQDFVNKKKR